MSRHHHHHEPPPPPCCSCGCACGCSALAPAPCGGYYPAPPLPAPASDQLLHAIAAHLLLNSAPPPPPQTQALPQQHPHPHPQQPPPQPPAAHHADLYSAYGYRYQHQQQQGPNHHAYPQPPQHQQQQAPQPHAYTQPPPQQQQQAPQPHTYPQPPVPAPPPLQHQQPYPSDHGQLLLHSLLRRVAALETTLPHCFPSPPPVPQPHPNRHRPHHRAAERQEEEEEEDPPSPPPRRPRARGGRPPPSERELAARTIQEHFRRFLARRSRTLRQLKELALLRSKAASLRGSLSGSGRHRCKDPVAVSEAAMGLLLHLDGIQGGDPMIREGKRAVSRELSRILEFVDKVLAKDHEEMALDNGEYPDGCHGRAPAANRPTVTKKVSFRNEPQNESDDSSESSSSIEAVERKGTGNKNIANGKPGLAAPAPVHMESRRAPGEMR